MPSKGLPTVTRSGIFIDMRLARILAAAATFAVLLPATTTVAAPSLTRYRSVPGTAWWTDANGATVVAVDESVPAGVAAGLANGGRIPFVSAASCFLTARALEQIKADVAYSDRNVKLCGMSPGVAYGELGPTHHSIEDLTWLRALPGLDIVVPADPAQTRLALRAVVGEVHAPEYADVELEHMYADNAAM